MSDTLSRRLAVWSRRLMVRSYLRLGRMRYGTNSTRRRHDGISMEERGMEYRGAVDPWGRRSESVSIERVAASPRKSANNAGCEPPQPTGKGSNSGPFLIGSEGRIWTDEKSRVNRRRSHAGAWRSAPRSAKRQRHAAKSYPATANSPPVQQDGRLWRGWGQADKAAGLSEASSRA